MYIAENKLKAAKFLAAFNLFFDYSLKEINFNHVGEC